MKTMIQIPKYMTLAFAILALTGWIASPISASAQVKGAAAAKLIKHFPTSVNPTTTAIKTGDKAANWCAKCRTSFVRVVERPTKTGATPEWKLIARNECSECVNTLATVGAGKLAKTALANACEECCEEDPMCCVVNAGDCPACPAVVARN